MQHSVTDEAGRYRHHWVIVPTFDEAENVAAIVSAIDRTLPGCTVLIVDDDSPDGTADIAAHVAVTNVELVVHRRCCRRGLGAAYLDGFSVALRGGAEVIVQMDADGSHDAAVLPRLIGLLRGSDLAIGSRYVEGGRIVGWPWQRRVLSRVANTYARRVLSVRTRDITSGFRAWTTAALRDVDIERVSSTGYAFLAEMLLLASRNRLLIAETPIEFRDREFGRSKMRAREVAGGALFLLRIGLRARPGPDKSPRNAPITVPAT